MISVLPAFDRSDSPRHKILYISNLFVLWLITGYLMAAANRQWCDLAGLPDIGNMRRSQSRLNRCFRANS